MGRCRGCDGSDKRARAGPAPRRYFETVQRARFEQLSAGLLLLGLLLVFFAEPLGRLETGVWSTADLTQDWPVTRVQEGHRPANPLLSDPPFQMQPWMLFALEELRAGRLPLWNPYNGGGQPLLANYQSGLLSPFHLPFLVLAFPAALVASAFFKLALLAWFTYLLLREWNLAQPAALLGALAFAFSGHNVLCLAYPHPGALAVLPAGMWCAERAFAHWRAARAGGPLPRRHLAWLAGLALCFGLSALAGHPEPFFFAAVGTGAVVAFRLGQLLRAGRKEPGHTAAVLRLALAFLGAAVVGTGLAAVQILPFLEYLQHSAALRTRLHNQDPLLLSQWALLFYPDLLGNPSSTFAPRLDLPVPNYEGANMLYPGALVLTLAAAGLFSRRASDVARAFGVLIAIWFLYAYDIGGSAALAARIPLLDLAPICRSQPLPLFAVACLAALGLDRLLMGAAPRGRALGIALALLGWTALLVATFRRGATHLLAEHADALGPADALAAHSAGHMGTIDGSLAIGMFAAAALTFVRAPGAQRVLCAVVLAALFFQNGWLARNYNPTVEQRFFYPRTEALEQLVQATAGELIVTLEDAPLPAESNLVYRIPLVSNYDALTMDQHDQLLFALFDPFEVGQYPRTASEKALRLFGARYILHTGNWPRIETEFGAELRKRRAPSKPWRVSAGRDLEQTLRASRSGLQAVVLTVGVEPAKLEGRLEVELVDAESGERIVHRSFAERELLEALDRHALDEAVIVRELVLGFEPRADSAGRAYRLRVRGHGDLAERAPACLIHEDFAPPHAGLLAAGEPHAGTLRADLSYAFDQFEWVTDILALRLSRYTSGLGRYYSVDAWRQFDDPTTLLRAMGAQEFDPYQVVCIGPGPGPGPSPLPAGGAASDSGSAAGARAARVLEEHPTRRRLEVERDTPGILVVAQNHDPGWRARVNGEAVPLWRANHAFTCLAVPAGRSLVELTYAPRSVALGLVLSLVSLLLTLQALLVGRRSRRLLRDAARPDYS